MARTHSHSRRAREAEPVRITTAATNRADDIAARQKRYLVSMGIRTVCFVGAVIAGLAQIEWLWPILIAGALILPYVAVVMANNSGSGSDGFELLDGDFGRAQLPPGTDPGRHSGDDGI